MGIILRHLALACVFCFAVLFCPGAFAVADKDNQGRWTKPTENNAPDKEVPGFLVNLGPTGARSVLTETTFIVRYIFKESPAVGRLNLDDVIVGVFGKPFSAHLFGGGHGYEGPIMEFGEAIEKAEGKDGKLVLNVMRGAKKVDVTIDLEAIGTFSSTFPINCKKSETLRAKALKYFADHPDSWNVWQAHARSAVALALLTSDDPKQQAIGKTMCLKWSGEKPDGGTWTWNLAYQIITLAEYHLMTKDASVIPMMKTTSEYLEKAQYQGRILVWGPTGDKALAKESYEKVDSAQQLYDGGFGHGPYHPGARAPNTGDGWGPNGYGPMQYPTIFAVIAWQLAERCGVDVNPDRLKRAMEFIHRGTNAGGYVAYGGEFTLNGGVGDPVSWKASTSGDNYVGRSGAALIAHKLSSEFPESADYIAKYRSYLKRAFKSLPDGHADANLGIIWGLMGSGAAEDDSVMRTMLDYHKAYFNMSRCFDGSFVLQPGRDYADNGYYMASRYHPTGSMVLMLGLGNPKLLIQGSQVSIPGVNPKALMGKLDVAYKAIVGKSYAEAARALKSARSVKTISAEDTTACDAMTAHVEARLVLDIARLETLEKKGDVVAVEAALAKVRSGFAGLDSLKEKIAHFEEVMKQDSWKAEIKVGTRYAQIVATLKRSRTPASVRELEQFAERNPDSLYGKWAALVAQEFRANGTIIDPATAKTPALAVSSTQ